MSTKVSPLGEAYGNLSRSEAISKRDLICYRCGITSRTFYRWCTEDQPDISPVNQEEISRILEIDVETLFPSDDDTPDEGNQPALIE